MEISLIRHGKSSYIINDRMTILEFARWIEKYDYHGVLEEKTYPEVTMEKIAGANLVITSDLTRSIESAEILNPLSEVVCLPLFREAELPIPTVQNLRFKLRPSSWAFLLRLLWLNGYSGQKESLNGAKQRAKKAAEELVYYAKTHQTIALVGHGFFNVMIAKELKKMGWKADKKTSGKHWICNIFTIDRDKVKKY
ncbi:histidine phosphatase family protein [Aquibacillus rhizosphaerae]|uniref:Histidine phosphatase family protein n=1 Tax=Aquibacillus rhizosphaerae TaxID=3051431 RepID=A0ABT7LEQ2_9BACI|nr:histidine phosphatase family protein [Aquibacillus sp. LR5S19]MDL4843021.1 histidine phosphatase family protein [Aquibacillus sp. LR5S19]